MEDYIINTYQKTRNTLNDKSVSDLVRAWNILNLTRVVVRVIPLEVREEQFSRIQDLNIMAVGM